MTLSNAAEIVFLAATVSVLLRVNHDRNGRPDSDDGNRGKATFGCVSPKNCLYNVDWNERFANCVDAAQHADVFIAFLTIALTSLYPFLVQNAVGNKKLSTR